MAMHCVLHISNINFFPSWAASAELHFPSWCCCGIGKAGQMHFGLWGSIPACDGVIGTESYRKLQAGRIWLWLTLGILVLLDRSQFWSQKCWLSTQHVFGTECAIFPSELPTYSSLVSNTFYKEQLSQKRKEQKLRGKMC